MKTIEQLQELFQNYLRHQNFSGKPYSLYQAVEYALQSGGKRIRPLMTLAACEMFSGNASIALPQAVAIELFHNFTLVHDDIMDNASLRRNQPTVFNKFGIATAILSGDLLMIKAAQYLNQCEADLVAEVNSVFNKTAIEVCEGQQLDMDFELRNDVTVDEYLKMIELKTAVLLGCSFQIGGLLGGANTEEQKHLFEFGKQLGIAFQLQDDWLDTFGEELIVGKEIGGDIFQNKKTWLLISAIQNSTSEQSHILNYWINKNEFEKSEKLNAVRNLFNEMNLKVDLKTKIELHYHLASEQLSCFKNVDTLKAFQELLSNRIH